MVKQQHLDIASFPDTLLIQLQGYLYIMQNTMVGGGKYPTGKMNGSLKEKMKKQGKKEKNKAKGRRTPPPPKKKIPSLCVQN